MARPATHVVWDDRFRRYDFGPSHPFSEIPRGLAVELLEAVAETAGPNPVPLRWTRLVEEAPSEALARFHRPEYLARVQRLSASGTGELLDQGDTPSFAGCYEASARLVAGTLRALDASIEGRSSAFAPAGGLHHAAPDRASGFCIFNDLAVAISTALAAGRRVAYVDIDAHHGDGVMYGFYDQGRVLDIDFHQDGRTIFPGTGFPSETGRGDGAGLKVHVPLPPVTGDTGFTRMFDRLVPVLLREFRPDLVVLQCGVDAHTGDRLGATGLEYTPRAYRHAVRSIRDLAAEQGEVPLLITGGGGYSAENVARVLAAVPLWLHDVDPPPAERLPSAWVERFHDQTGARAPDDWSVEAAESPWSPRLEARIAEELERALGRRFPPSDPPR
ncbi:MAG TPA: acetoin utilization protein AcuC [Thermoplasmata archaeon]|nr:acetoin utilization protein AcuC [Thermoplasmata archaeon]